ncbi:MAG: tetratricopeptide repeat protein [Myxococcales bacterium]|nr:tetratricopeptide repeat protein [Myxococcales bacterium]
MKRVCVFVVLFPVLAGFELWRTSNRRVEQGNAKLEAGAAADALALYERALEHDGLTDPQARAATEFNRGSALSALEKHDEAAQAFLEATKSKDVSLRARAFYNLGNTFFKGDKFSEAVEAYKRSLLLDPKSPDAKWNLELALRRKDEQKKQDENQDPQKQDSQKQDPQKNQNNPQDQQGQDQSKTPDTQGQDQNEQDPGEKDPEPQDGESPQEGSQGGNSADEAPEPKPETEPQPPPPSEASPAKPEQPDETQGAKGGAASGSEGNTPDLKEINAILDSLEQSPHQIEQQRARLRATRRAPPVKDW